MHDRADHVENSTVEAVEEAKGDVRQRVDRIADNDERRPNQAGDSARDQFKQLLKAVLIEESSPGRTSTL